MFLFFATPLFGQWHDQWPRVVSPVNLEDFPPSNDSVIIFTGVELKTIVNAVDGSEWQWPIIDGLASFPNITNAVDSCGGKWAYNNRQSVYYYTASIDDGFGDTWGFTYDTHDNVIYVRRPGYKGRFYNGIGVQPIKPYNDQLKFHKSSLPIETGLRWAFYGYLTALHKADIELEALLWIDMKTGGINGVMFRFRPTVADNDLLFSVPFHNFAIFEDILKKTVTFKVPHRIVYPQWVTEWIKKHKEKPETIYYHVDIQFPAPAEGEPDFLKYADK